MTKPIGYLTTESLTRLRDGGNGSRETVPLHAKFSHVAKCPVYLHTATFEAPARVVVDDALVNAAVHALLHGRPPGKALSIKQDPHAVMRFVLTALFGET